MSSVTNPSASGTITALERPRHGGIRSTLEGVQGATRPAGGDLLASAAMTKSERSPHQERLDAMRKRLAAIPADGLFATPSSNLFYLTGIDFWRSERLTALLLFADREPVVLCPAFEESRLRGMSAVGNLVTWQETENPFEKAAKLFPAAAGSLAIEPSTAYEDVERLLTARPGWKPISAGSAIAALRMVKTPGELAAMRRAVELALPRFARAFGSLKPGAVEADVSAAFGGENVVQFGESSAMPHGASTARRLAKDEAVLIDAWDRPEGYFYDITRSTFFGKPSDEYRKVWQIVLEAQSAAIERAAPGVRCSDVDAAARRVIEKAGYGSYFTHRLGHGLGIDVHEPPYMVADNATLLEPGMTFTSEPGIYLPGRFGVRIEDDIVVTERAAESLSPRVSRLEPIAA
jgi:Xaa-Pro dipeptidase